MYDEDSCFGDRRWTVWRVGAGTQPTAPTYFTVYPNDHLDVHVDMYSTDRIEQLFPYSDELIRLYYAYVHPSYPILGPQETFIANRSAGCIPASLLALVYIHATDFWYTSPQATSGPYPNPDRLIPYIFTCLAHETHTPNIAVVQAILLFLHLRPRWVRAPNHPGTWALSCMLVGVAQDIGLNLDPSSWTLAASERKLRRILWWAVFVNDKWTSHWLGRSSHIVRRNWNVAPLSLDDFSGPDGRLAVESFSWASAFVSFCSLSIILSDVLDTFYTIRSNFDRMKVAFAIDKARPLLEHLDHWKREHPLPSSAGQPYVFSVHVAALGLQTSIHRAVFGAQRVPQDPDVELERNLAGNLADSVQTEVLPLLQAMQQVPAIGLWLSYTKGNITLIGGSLITLLLSSLDDEELECRRQLLLAFRQRLEALVNKHDFARLPLRRLNLIIEELFEADAGSIIWPGGGPRGEASIGLTDRGRLSVMSLQKVLQEEENQKDSTYRIPFPIN